MIAKADGRRKMTELSKELTPKLLGLVYGFTITGMKLQSKINETQRIHFTFLDEDGIEYSNMLDLDTLTRLMKEWLLNGTNDIINTFNSSSIQGWVCTSSIYNVRCLGDTEFEAVLKATELVAKEKGLI